MSSAGHRQPFSAAVYFTAYVVPAFCLLAIGRTPLLVLVALSLIFVVNPVTDRLVQLVEGSIARFTVGRSHDAAYAAAIYLAIPVQLALVVRSLTHATTGLSAAITAGLLCGVSGGIIGLVAGHELIHRPRKAERRLGYVLLFITNYPHFLIEHVLHHRWVAMPEDPDTARRGESLYRFLVRSIPAGWLACWQWEAEKARRRGGSPLSLRNKMLRVTGVQVLLLALITLGFGPLGGLIFAIQGFVSLMLLKWVNYVEHYGLERRVIEGRPEVVGVEHSWDSPTAFSNWALFNLGHHSHHHSRPNVPYQDLPTAGERHEMPAGYAAMMVVALCPPLWRHIVHPRLPALARS